MTLFEGEQNGRYETDHLHMVLNEHIYFTEEGLSDDRKYSIFVHEYVHYYLMWLYTGYIKDRRQFMTLVNAYGLPYIETPEMTYLPNNNETGHPYLETATLAGFELIFRRLQKIDGDICPMYRVCKDGRFSEESNVDELCGKEQWKKDCECLMVRALKYYKLKDKEFVL